MTPDDDIPYPLFVAIDSGPAKLLTREQEHQLAVRAREGDARARGQLVERNLRLVVKLAANRAPQLELQDLVSEGVLGLMRAIDKFDPYSGFKLSTYATRWIKQAICRAADKDGTVSLPIELRREVRAAEHRLHDDLGRLPTDQELMCALPQDTQARIDLYDLGAARAAMHCASLDRSVDAAEGEGTPLGALVADPHSADPAEIVTDGIDLRADVAAITSSLARNERALVERRFGLGGREPQTLTTTAREIGIERDEARRLERQAFQKMREAAGMPTPPVVKTRPAERVLDLLSGPAGRGPTSDTRSATRTLAPVH